MYRPFVMLIAVIGAKRGLTERILWKIKSSHHAKTWSKPEGGGYIWHTTGSGKTLTSFKAEGSDRARRNPNRTNLDEIEGKDGVIAAFFAFAQEEQRREFEELVATENLNLEAAKRYVTSSIKREFASENGNDLRDILPKMSPLNPEYLTKKSSVFQRISDFVAKFKGVGGKL